MNLPNLDEADMSDSCLFVSVYLCLSICVSICRQCFFDVIFIDGFSGSG